MMMIFADRTIFTKIEIKKIEKIYYFI